MTEHTDVDLDHLRQTPPRLARVTQVGFYYVDQDSWNWATRSGPPTPCALCGRIIERGYAGRPTREDEDVFICDAHVAQVDNRQPQEQAQPQPPATPEMATRQHLRSGRVADTARPVHFTYWVRRAEETGPVVAVRRVPLTATTWLTVSALDGWTSVTKREYARHRKAVQEAGGWVDEA